MFLVMSFSITNAPGVSMDLMNRVFQNYLGSFVIVFIDDILVYSNNNGDDMVHLRVVLQTLKGNQLYVKYINCEFWLRSVTFLGHIISSEGVEVDPRKTKMVKNWPTLQTTTNSRSFFDLAGYYQRYVDGFPSIASPLTTLTQKGKKFEWPEACEKSFQLLKHKLTSALVLTLLKGTKGFVVYCDASRVGLGCVLMQKW